MNKEEIKEYLKKVDELEFKLVDEDKDALQWLIFGYNECARLLNEKEKENQRLKEIEKEHQRINGCLHLEIKELKDRIDKIVEIIEKEIESLKDKKRMIMQILTPENGYLKTDVEYEIKRLERYLEILKGDKE